MRPAEMMGGVTYELTVSVLGFAEKYFRFRLGSYVHDNCVVQIDELLNRSHA